MQDIYEILQSVKQDIIDKEHLREDIEVLEKIDRQMGKEITVDSFYHPTVLRILGMLYTELQEYETALRIYRRGLRVAKSDKNKGEIGQNLVSLAELYYKMGDIQGAKEYIDKVKVFEGIHFGTKFYEIHINISNILGSMSAKKGDIKKANYHFKKAVDKAIKCGYDRGMLVALEEISKLYTGSEQGKSIRWISALAKASKKKFRHLLPEFHLLLAYIYIESEKFEKARASLGKALQLSEEQSLIKYVGEVYEAYGELSKKEKENDYFGHYQKALDYYASGGYENKYKNLSAKINLS